MKPNQTPNFVKPGLNYWLEVELIGMDELWDRVAQIEILFRQNKSVGVSKHVLWSPNDEGADCKRGPGNTLLIRWTRDETYQFKANEHFYMDIRPTLNDGTDLHVEPVQFCMTWTLFKDEGG